MEEISKKDNLTALDKLVQIFQFSSSFRVDIKGIMEYIHEERNIHLHRKFEQRIPYETVEPLAYILSLGVAEGVFNTEYPEDARRESRRTMPVPGKAGFSAASPRRAPPAS